MAKTQKLGLRFEILEFFRRHVALDAKLPGRWLQILADRDDVDVVVAQILQGRENFSGLVSPTPSIKPDLVSISGRCFLAAMKRSSEPS